MSHLEDMKRAEFERMVANGELDKCKGKQTMDINFMDLKKKVDKEKEKLEKKKNAGWYSLSVAVSMLRDCGVNSHEIQKMFREIVYILYEL